MKYFKELLVIFIFAVSIPVSQKFTDIFVVPKQFFFLISISLLTFGWAAWLLLKKNKKIWISFDAADMLIVLMTLYILTQYFYFTGFDKIEQVVFVQLFYLFFYIVIKQALISKKYKLKLEFIFFGILIFPFIQVFYGLLQKAGLLKSHMMFFDIGGSFGNPGPYANYLVAFLPLSLGFLLLYKKNELYRPLRIMSLITCIGILIALPLTEARTSWIAGIAAIGILLSIKYSAISRIWHGLKTRVTKLIFIFLTLGITGIAAYGLFSYKADSSHGRLFIWKITLENIAEASLFGKGFNAFLYNHNIKQAVYFETNPDDTDTGYLADNVIHAFNDYLEITAETGLTGLMLLLAALGYPLYLVIAKRYKAQSDKRLVWIMATGIVVIMVSALFSYPLANISNYLLLLLLLTVITSHVNMGRKEIALNKTGTTLISILVMAITLSVFTLQTKRLKAQHKWKHAKNLLQEQKYHEAFTIYEEIYPVLNYSSHFLYNYGSERSLVGDYQKSLELLLECEARLNDADFYSYLGNTYEGLGELQKAKEAFVQASHIIPHKLYPHYRLVYIYAKMNRHELARKQAKKVLNMEPKVESDVVKQIKSDLWNFLKSRE